MKIGEEFTKSENLEDALCRINAVIADESVNDAHELANPTMLIMGCPRSGSTLFMQWISELGCFGYPSNLIARFYGNPAFGCEVQRALVDFDKENQIGLALQKQEFDSSLGRTQGASAPSEFWYYWRRFFKFNDVQKLSQSELKSADFNGFIKGLAGMEKSLGLPLVMKGMLLNWHIEYLSKRCPLFFFVQIQRDLFYVAQSILESRERYCGSRKGWWSLKPPGYHDWLHMSPIEQVAAQVVYTERAVLEGMKQISTDRKMKIDYADFCMDPESIFREIAGKYKNLGCDIQIENNQWRGFQKREDVRISDKDEKALRGSLERLQAEGAR